MPALPKTFYFQTTFGEEWKGFWNGLWWRAERAISSADELVVIGYSLPTADERARAMLLRTKNKTARLTVCCANGTGSIEREFRDNGFTNIETGAPTFDDFLAREATRTDTDAAPTSPTTTLSRLNALTGKQGLLKIQYAGEVGFTFLSVDPAPGLPTATNDTAIQTAIDRSHFLVRFDEGTLIDGRNTRVISGHHISLIRGRY